MIKSKMFPVHVHGSKLSLLLVSTGHNNSGAATAAVWLHSMGNMDYTALPGTKRVAGLPLHPVLAITGRHTVG